MQLTKGAIGNLINRYRAVLKKCHLMNVFGSLAVAGMLVMGGAGAAGAATAGIIITTDRTDSTDIDYSGAVDYGVYAKAATGTFTGNKLSISTTPGTLGHGNVGLWATSTSPESARSVINFGQADTTESININVTDNSTTPDIAIGVWSRGDPNKVGGEINLSAETVTISGHSNTGWIYGIYAQNTTTATDYDRATININAGKTYIDVTSGQPGRANAIVAMSQGVINIESDLYVNTRGGEGDAIVTRGDSIIAINTSGTHTVQMNGDVNFNYDGSTSGTKVDADVNITLSGADSYWNGNTLISWNGTPSDESKLTVSEMTLTVKDGATWTPTAIENTADQKYASLNNLILDNGNIDVREGVTIAIDNVSGAGYLNNEGTVTLTSGALEGRTDNAGIINLNPGASASEVTFEKGELTPSKALIAVDAERTTLNGGMATGENAFASVTGVAMSAEKDVMINGVEFKGNTFTADRNYPIIGAVTANLGDDQSLTITGSTFGNNTVTLTGTGSSGSSGGAAVSVKGQGTDSRLTITDSTFSGNRYNDTEGAANGAYGGAIGVQNASVTLTNVTLSGNSGDSGNQVQGGGYYQSIGSLDATQLKVSENNVKTSSSLMGAGMVLWGTSGSISDSEFTGNTAEVGAWALGGGLYLRGSRWGGESDLAFSISNTTFSGNSLTSTTDDAQGGGLYVKGDASNGTADGNGKISLNLANVTFDGNTVNGANASQGGAMYVLGVDDNGNGVPTNASVTVTNGTFTNNTAEGASSQGGAIFNAGALTVDNSTFTGNTVTGEHAHGGAIFNAGQLTFTGTNTFSDNMAAEKASDIYNIGVIDISSGTTTLEAYEQGDNNGQVTGSIALNVNAGATLNAGTVNVKAGALNVTGGVVNVTESLLSAEAGDNSGKGINVTNSGVLSADKDILLSSTESDLQRVEGLESIYLGSSGTLQITGMDAAVAFDDVSKYQQALATVDGGLISFDKGIDTSGATGDNGYVDSGAAESSGALLDGATVEYTGDETDHTDVRGGYGADAIVITNAADGDHTVTVQNDLTLTGDGSGTLINVENQNAELTTITVSDGKTLNLGNAAAEINNGTLEATVVLEGDSTLNAAAGDYTIEAVATDQDGTGTVNATAGVNLKMGTIGEEGNAVAAVTADGGNLAAGDIYANNVSVNNGGNLVAGTITVSEDATITVGSEGDAVGGSTLITEGINGGKFVMDPEWGQASGNAANGSLTNNDIIIAQNNYSAVGTTDITWLPSIVDKVTNGVGLSENGVNVAFGVYQNTLTIANGKNLAVNGTMLGRELEATLVGQQNTATFAEGSLLVVNGTAFNANTPVINFGTPGTLNVADGAKLLITDAVVGRNYTIVGNVQNANVVGWKNNVLESTTDMISLGDATHDNVNNTVTTTAQRNDAHTVFPNLSGELADAVNDLYTGHDGAAGAPRWDYADVNSDDMGVRFLSRATDNRFLGADKQAAASTIESAARMAFAGAVPQMTRMASDAATNAVVNRLGFANPVDGAQAMNAEGKIVDRRTTGFALWIAPLWQNMHGWGMEAGDLDYGFNGNLGGVSLGADYTFENAIRAGITFNIGGGYAESSGGDLNSTENRMTFWGLGAYAGWNYQNFGLMADVSYTSTWNDLSQDMDGRMGMGDLEADVQATAISAGLRAEYKLETSALDIIPHIGVRYMSLNTWGYDVDTHGGTVLEGDGFHQDIWTFPIGVTFSKEITMDSGWFFKPSVDFSVIPAAGDIKAKEDVRFTGLPGSYEVETQMMDYLTWQGGVGIQLGNDNLSFGVNYTLQAGQNTTGHGVFGNFRYEF